MPCRGPCKSKRPCRAGWGTAGAEKCRSARQVTCCVSATRTASGSSPRCRLRRLKEVRIINPPDFLSPCPALKQVDEQGRPSYAIPFKVHFNWSAHLKKFGMDWRCDELEIACYPRFGILSRGRGVHVPHCGSAALDDRVGGSSAGFVAGALAADGLCRLRGTADSRRRSQPGTQLHFAPAVVAMVRGDDGSALVERQHGLSGPALPAQPELRHRYRQTYPA